MNIEHRTFNVERSMLNVGSSVWILITAFLAFFFYGCAVQKRICPPLSTADDAKAVLSEYAAGLAPLKATGTCRLNYKDEKGKDTTQSFPVRIWFENPRKFCLYGDIMFDPKGMSFALDGSKYWVYAKPFNVYVKGEINEKNVDFRSGPAVFLDFLQPFGAGCGSLYMAEKTDKDFNILICRNSSGCGTKEIFIDRCEKLVKKIRYLNCSGNILVIVELDEYKNVTGHEDLVFPHKLTYSYYKGQDCIDRREIKLNSVKSWRPDSRQIEALFRPPAVDNTDKAQ